MSDARAYYKLLNGVSPANGGHGDWYRPSGKRPGKWMPAEVPIPCRQGYHLLTEDQVLLGESWSGTHLWRAEARGTVVDHGDKVVAAQARLVSRVPGWTPRNLALFASVCAARVLPVFEAVFPDDQRPRDAIRAYADADAADARDAADAVGASAARASAAARVSAARAAYAAAYAASAAPAAYAAYAAATSAAYARAASPSELAYQHTLRTLILTESAYVVEAEFTRLIEDALR